MRTSSTRRDRPVGPRASCTRTAVALAYVRLAAAAYDLAPSDRFANIAGLHFDQSTFELYVAPFVGAAVTVVPDAVLRFPASVSELVERERVTVWYSVPYVLRQLVTRGALDARDLRSIRWILYGGESYPPDELADLMRALPAATVSNVYGPAEVNQCMRHDLTEPPVPARRRADRAGVGRHRTGRRRRRWRPRRPTAPASCSLPAPR